MEVIPNPTCGSGDFSHQQCTGSPLTSDGSLTRLERTTSKPDRALCISSQDLAQDAAGVGQASHHCCPSRCEDISSFRPSLGLGLLASKPESLSSFQSGTSAFQHSDPGSPIVAERLLRGLKTLRLNFQGSDDSEKGLTTRSGGSEEIPSQPVQQGSREGSQEAIVELPYRRSNKKDEQNGLSVSPNRKISSAASELHSFSSRTKRDGKVKPNTLILAGRRSTDELVRTPYPVNRANGSKQKALGKLVSKLKKAGDDVISRLQFISEQLWAEIQHHDHQPTEKLK